jgi:hypothetical protein
MKVKDQKQCKKGFALANSWLPNPGAKIYVGPCVSVKQRFSITGIVWYR